jgi:HEAT repeat protein
MAVSENFHPGQHGVEELDYIAGKRPRQNVPCSKQLFGFTRLEAYPGRYTVMSDFNFLLDNLNSDDFSEYLQAAQNILERGKIATLALTEVMLNCSDREGWRAARLLVEMKDPSTVPAFILALRSPHPLIRQLAVQALEDQRNVEVVPYLIERLGQNDIMLQIRIIEALGNLGDNRAVAPLLALLTNTESTALQHSIITALGRIADPEAAEALPQFFRSTDHHVRAKAHDVYKQLVKAA